jgi:hypothetical protein
MSIKDGDFEARKEDRWYETNRLLLAALIRRDRRELMGIITIQDVLRFCCCMINQSRILNSANVLSWKRVITEYRHIFEFKLYIYYCSLTKIKIHFKTT